MIWRDHVFNYGPQNRLRGWQNFEKKLSRLAPRQFFFLEILSPSLPILGHDQKYDLARSCFILERVSQILNVWPSAVLWYFCLLSIWPAHSYDLEQGRHQVKNLKADNATKTKTPQMLNWKSQDAQLTTEYFKMLASRTLRVWQRAKPSNIEYIVFFVSSMIYPEKWRIWVQNLIQS